MIHILGSLQVLSYEFLKFRIMEAFSFYHFAVTSVRLFHNEFYIFYMLYVIVCFVEFYALCVWILNKIRIMN